MKKVILSDSMYPIYWLEDEYLNYPVVEIPQDKLDWINSVSIEFQETQDYLRELQAEVYK